MEVGVHDLAKFAEEELGVIERHLDGVGGVGVGDVLGADPVLEGQEAPHAVGLSLLLALCSCSECVGGCFSECVGVCWRVPACERAREV